MSIIQSTIIISLAILLLSPMGKPETEEVVQSLVDFMRKLGPGSMQNTSNWGWNTSSDPCRDRWFGVKCDSSNQTVKNIVLEQIGLSGTVDFNSVCKESSLLLLSLKYNNLSGSLDQEISNCKKIRLLHLNGNHFSSNLPESLINLANLVRIDVSDNQFSGKLPNFSRNNGLLTFLAKNNRFIGELPKFNYHQLQEFDVSNNDLTGQIPDDTGNFGAKSFLGNPNLCGKELKNECQVKKKKKGLHKVLMYSGYAILGLIVLGLVALLFLKKRRNLESLKVDEKRVEGRKDSPVSSGVSPTRSEFSITSAENGAVSASLVVLTSPVEAVNGLRFDDLLRAPAELIGRGKHGSLYKVIPNGGVPLVVKRVKDWEISKDEFKERMQRIDEVKHPKVLPLVAYYCSKKEKLLVYEFQQNGSLFKLLNGSQNGQILDWGSRLNIACNTSQALAFMHRELKHNQIAHGNLKSSNILLTNDMDSCMSEYGLMLVDNGAQTTNAFNVDVYAFGVVLLELVTGKPVQTSGFELAKWVNSVVKEEWTGEVFDKALVVEGVNEARMVGLLQIALKCIDGSADLRPGMDHVAGMIGSLKEEEERSIASFDLGFER